MEILVIIVVALLLGWSVITFLPKATGFLPATLQANKWVMMIATGVFIIIAFFVIAWAAKETTGRSVPV